MTCMPCMAVGSGGTLESLEWCWSSEIVAVGESCDTMAAAKESCDAVQRAADGADIVEADRWQQVAAWLSGWAWRRVWRPAGLEAVL